VTESEAVVTSAKLKLSPIWIVPIAAVILGIWLAIAAYLSQGPTVTVTFASASGIEKGKTLVKVLSIDIGLVTDVGLSDDLEGVTVTLELEPQARELLREDTQFWVVRPTVRGTNISGLSTLLSGAYVEFTPGVESVTRMRSFTGLDQVPAAPAGTPGLRLQLTSRTSGSVGVGSPINYRGFRVGTVESTDLDVESQRVTYSIFVDSPYDRLISSNTRFWNASGISAELNTEGFKLSMSSLQSALAGGIAFDLPEKSSVGDPVTEEMVFRLYANEGNIHEDPHRHYIEYVVEFYQSLRGLRPGAPVSYRGIRLGEVTRILIDQMSDDAITAGSGRPIPVLIKLEPGRLELGDTREAEEFLRETIDIAVANGLRATLQSGNILTGSLYIGLDIYDEAKPVESTNFNQYPTIPTTGSGFDHIQVQVNRLLNKLNSLPLEESVATSNAAIEELKLTLAALRSILDDESAQNLTEALEKTLVNMSKLIQGYSAGSEFHTELNRTLVDLRQTLDSLKGVTDRLSDNPNAIVFPSEAIEDPEPKAPRQ
jgi:paraquat-inducible protein B